MLRTDTSKLALACLLAASGAVGCTLDLPAEPDAVVEGVDRPTPDSEPEEDADDEGFDDEDADDEGFDDEDADDEGFDAEDVDDEDFGDEDADDAGEGDDPSGPVADGAILTLGDSVMEWNVDVEGSIPQVIGDALGRQVVSRAESGAWLVGDDDDIRSQYRAGDWSWVVFDGGLNDLNDGCDCGPCDDMLDEMISTDATRGALPAFARRLVDAGHQVLILGYYDVPDGAQHGFDRCRAWGQRLTDRQRRLAESNPRVHFVDGSRAVSRDDLSQYDSDRVHPSVRGSRALGQAVAEAIRRVE